jgi:small GTP-binding protein
VETTIALAGNPNSGKTTLFNELTGARQHVGNYPGVTVEKKQGTYVSNGYKMTIVDLPGTYSLTAYSLEEVVARDFEESLSFSSVYGDGYPHLYSAEHDRCGQKPWHRDKRKKVVRIPEDSGSSDSCTEWPG